MNRTPVRVSPADYPAAYAEILTAPAFDSSCSPEARVIYLERDGGLFLKSSAAGTLAREAAMTRFFHTHHLAAEVLDYRTEGERDWLLTARVPGEDATHAENIADPAHLCRVMAEVLQILREIPPQGCPVPDHTARYLRTAEENYLRGAYDLSYYSEDYGDITADEAYRIVTDGASALRRCDVLHGDFCLPNIMLLDGKFSGIIDVGNGGIGDRRVDLWWGAWTLRFNLKTDAWRQYFLDACGGTDGEDREVFRLIAAAECFG